MAKVRKTRTARTLAGVSAIALGLTGALAASGAAFAAQGENGTPPANTNADTTGSLTIHKYLGPVGAPGNGLGTYTPPAGTVPLGGVEFTVKQLGITVQGDTELECEVIDLHDSSQNLDWNKLQGTAPAAPTPGVPAVGATVGDLCLPEEGATYILTTSTTSGADFGTVTQKEMPLSAYYVYESDASGAVTEDGEPITVASHAVPFFVTVPLPTVATDGTPAGTGGSGQNWVYDVNVYPKNQDVTEPTKTVDEELSDLTVGQQLTWTILAPIPDLSDPITVAKIYDELDDNLKFVSTTSVKVDGADAVGVLESQPAADDTSSIDWDFGSTAGLALMNANKGKNIEIVFVTQVTALPESGIVDNPGGTIGNGYGSLFNDTETGGSTDPGKAAGLLKITKVDAADATKTLAGAKFTVYPRPIDGTSGDYVACATDAPTTGTIFTGTSDNNGVVQWDPAPGHSPLNLPIAVWQDKEPESVSKDYCVYETQAPSGYTAAKDALVVTMTPGGTEDLTISPTIQNTRSTGPTLPLTGAAGTTLLIVGGLGLVAVAFGASMVIRNRQRKNA